MTILYDWLKKAAKVQGNTRKALRYRDNYLSWRGLLERVDRRIAAEATASALTPDEVRLRNGQRITVDDIADTRLGRQRGDCVIDVNGCHHIAGLNT